MSDLIDKVANSIAEKYAPMHDGRAPYAKFASREAAKDAIATVLEEAANIALAIDSGRGNEKEIARAIRALATQSPPPPSQPTTGP